MVSPCWQASPGSSSPKFYPALTGRRNLQLLAGLDGSVPSERLLRDPKLLVLDEPANGLDPAGIRDMRTLVKRLATGGLTVLLTSHGMGEDEQICHDLTIVRNGSSPFSQPSSPATYSRERTSTAHERPS